MRWILFEDKGADNLSPIALTRPVFELVCGGESLRGRLQCWFPSQAWGVRIRPRRQDIYAEENPGCETGMLPPKDGSPTLLINGRWMPGGRLHADEATLPYLGDQLIQDYSR